MTDRELMQQALEALLWEYGWGDPKKPQLAAITALRERLAQPEQEPVAHTLNCVCGAVWDVSPDGVEEMVHAPNPTQRSAECFEDYEKATGMNQWQGLTDEKKVKRVYFPTSWITPVPIHSQEKSK